MRTFSSGRTDGRSSISTSFHRKIPGLYVLGQPEIRGRRLPRFEEMAQMIVADIHARSPGVRRDASSSTGARGAIFHPTCVAA
jgi:hypothetical protein